ncbi:MAG: YceI family protein [Steroidobacterales bacterium]
MLAYRPSQPPATAPLESAVASQGSRATRTGIIRSSRLTPAIALLATLCIAACRSIPAPRPQAAPAAPAAAAAVPAGAARYRIDGGQSEVLILVYRDGRMANLGHNHVVAVRQLAGEISLATDPTQSSWQLDFPVAALSVDEPQRRAAQGAEFQTRLDDVAIAGTRDHMLGPQLLDAAQFPAIHLQSEQIRSDSDGLHLSARIVVRDHAVQVDVPLALERSPEQLIASGEFDLTHAQLGLTPYSVALGALRVADRMHVRYRLVAQRAGD